jgi:hypothetical protein
MDLREVAYPKDSDLTLLGCHLKLATALDPF